MTMAIENCTVRNSLETKRSPLQPKNVLLMRGSICRTLSLVVTVGSSLFLMPAILHTIGDRWYGLWSVVGTILGYYGFLDLGLSSATQTFIARATAHHADRDVCALVTTSLALFSLLGFLAFIVSVGIAFCAPLFFTVPHERTMFFFVMLIMGINPLISFPMMAFNGLFTAHLRYDLTSGLETARVLVQTIVIYCLLPYDFSILYLALVTLACTVLLCLARLGIVRHTFGKLHVAYLAFDRHLISELFSYGGRSFLVQLSEILKFQLDAFVITMFHTLSMVTTYNISAQIIIYLRRLVGAAINIMIPVYAQYSARGEWEQVRSTFLSASKMAMAISAFLAANVIVFGHIFIRLWVGPAYGRAYTVLMILTIGTLGQVSVQPAVNLLFGLAQHGKYAKVCLLEGVGNLLLSLLLIQPLGVEGVALGTTLPMIVTTLWLVRHVLILLNLEAWQYGKQVLPALAPIILVNVAVWWLFNIDAIVSFSALFVFVLPKLCFETLLIIFVGFTTAERRSIYGSFVRLCRREKAVVEEEAKTVM